MIKQYKLYETNRNGSRVLVFHSAAQRQRFLIKQRQTAESKKLQLLYKGTEYLRIYSNCMLYQEYDIRGRREVKDTRQQAERFFKHG